MRLFASLPREAHLATAGISFLGALGAMVIALRTHETAPLCGGAHCPACYVAAVLAAVGLVTIALAGLTNPASASIR